MDRAVNVFGEALEICSENPKAGFFRDGCWCLCAAQWLEAHENEMAPRVFLKRTHRRALEIVSLDLLRQFAADLN
ncbi:MAG: DUF2237 family protein [Proteobacteria bacterium]|nr:DUF2237 family protein [Pseudomonadota bacterium]